MAASQHHRADLDAYATLQGASNAGGGAAAQRRQRRLGRMLVRERLQTLCDPGSVCEMGALHQGQGVPGDGVVCALAQVAGRPVAVYGHDITVQRGALGVVGGRKILRLLDWARGHGLPVVVLNDSDGVRISEGPQAMAVFGDILQATARLSGWVPQISVAHGLCVGGAAYAAALCDIVIGQVDTGYLCVTGASVTREMTGEDASLDVLGGVSMHASQTGLVHLSCDNDAASLAAARAVLQYLPSHATAGLPTKPCDDPVDRPTPEIYDIVPASHRRPYDARKLVAAIVDGGSFLELQRDFARNLIVGFARLGGLPVGVVSSQPLRDAGALDVSASRKGARFIQLCNCFGLPVVTLADVPGFRPGPQQEQSGLLLHGAKLIAAYAACEVPLISLIVRKSYGGGSVLSWSGDVRLAYPFARVQAMGAQAAATHREEAAVDGPGQVALSGFADRVIFPEATRQELCALLASLHGQPKHTTRPSRRMANTPC